MFKAGGDELCQPFSDEGATDRYRNMNNTTQKNRMPNIEEERRKFEF